MQSLVRLRGRYSLGWLLCLIHLVKLKEIINRKLFRINKLVYPNQLICFNTLKLYYDTPLS